MKQQNATRLLNRASEGEIAAAADLLPLVYDELHALAQSYFRDERMNHTLQPTALVHEAYLRLVDQTAIEFKSRNQFFVIAAKVMRNILVDHARTRGRAKRGGSWQEVTMHAVEQTFSAPGSPGSAPGPGSGGGTPDPLDMIMLHDAMERLALLDERMARLVELRFFAGLSEQDAAEVLGIARSTASEEWRLARAWLQRALKDTPP